MQTTAGKIELARFALIDRFPARKDLAELHMQANKFGRPSTTDLRLCSCCDERINNEPFQYCLASSEPSLPAGISLFFMFIKISVVFLALKFTICDGYDVYTNWFGGDCSKRDGSATKQCESNASLRASVINKQNHHELLFQMDIMHLYALFVFAVYFLLVRLVQYREYVQHDIGEHTQDDYAIYVRNIPSVLLGESKFNFTQRLKAVFEEMIGQWVLAGQRGGDTSRLWKSYVETINRPHNVEARSRRTPASSYFCK